MARVFVAAELDYLEVDAAPVTAAPFSLACWARPTDVTINPTSLWIGDKDNSAIMTHLYLVGTVAGDPIRFESIFGGTAANAQSTTGVTVNTWHHMAGVLTATDDRRVYLDGGSTAQNTTSVSLGTPDRVSVGRRGDLTPSNYWSGNIAEAAIWSAALTAADVAALAKGFSPRLIRPDALAFYAPIIGKYSPEIDLIGGNGLTVNGAGRSEHPRVFNPKRRSVVTAPTAAAAAARRQIPQWDWRSPWNWRPCA